MLPGLTWSMAIPPFFESHWQSLCTALTSGKCLPLGLCKETVRSVYISICEYKQGRSYHYPPHPFSSCTTRCLRSANSRWRSSVEAALLPAPCGCAIFWSWCTTLWISPGDCGLSLKIVTNIQNHWCVEFIYENMIAADIFSGYFNTSNEQGPLLTPLDWN